MLDTAEENASSGFDIPFFNVPKEFVDYPEECPPLTSIELMVYVVLYRYVATGGESSPSYTKIASAARCSRRSAIRAISKLEEFGLLSKENEYNSDDGDLCNHYTLFLPSQIQAEKKVTAE